MVVVKLGGSLAATDDLKQWLELISEAGGGRCILVPGGGPFADSVRKAQQQWGFSDSVAHQMALLAMVQYGLMLGDLKANLVPVKTKTEIEEVLQRGQVPVWLPVPMASNDPDLECSWRVTSDSLALWLACRLKISVAVLVKSVQPQTKNIATLVATGFVDKAFGEYAEHFEDDIVVVTTADIPGCRSFFSGGDSVGHKLKWRGDSDV